MAGGSKSEVRDVVIVGGGCAGLWLGLELVQRKISCVVVDVVPFASYASTRNQGWLQSGALYAALGDDATASICQEGFGLIRDFARDFAPRAMQPPVPCYFLFQDRGELDRFESHCDALRVPITSVAAAPSTIDSLLLRGTSLKYAATMPDCPIDTTVLLQAVAQRAADEGAEFIGVSALDALRAEPCNTGWQIYLAGGRSIECQAVVLACGSYIPHILTQMVPNHEAPLKRLKITTLVLHSDPAEALCEAMFVTPYIPQSPSLIPFSTSYGKGATVCLLKGHAAAMTHLDTDLSDGHLEFYANILSKWYPGIKRLLSQGGRIGAHFYTCQTLELASSSSTDGSGARSAPTHVMLSYRAAGSGGGNLLVFYPRKFTAAPYVARECAERIQAIVGPSGGDVSASAAPHVATQPYYLPSAFSLVLQHDQLIFKQLG